MAGVAVEGGAGPQPGAHLRWESAWRDKPRERGAVAGDRVRDLVRPPASESTTPRLASNCPPRARSVACHFLGTTQARPWTSDQHRRRRYYSALTPARQLQPQLHSAGPRRRAKLSGEQRTARLLPKENSSRALTRNATRLAARARGARRAALVRCSLSRARRPYRWSEVPQEVPPLSLSLVSH